MSSCGTKDRHCCWIKGNVCEYLVKNDSGEFIWSCSLRSKVDNWKSVYEMKEYIDNVKPKLLDAGINQDCGEWPPLGKKCNTCGLENNG